MGEDRGFHMFNRVCEKIKKGESEHIEDALSTECVSDLYFPRLYSMEVVTGRVEISQVGIAAGDEVLDILWLQYGDVENQGMSTEIVSFGL